MLAQRRIALLVLLWVLDGSAFLPAQEKQQEQPPAVCPALDKSSPYLAVLGIPRPVAGQPEIFEVRIEKHFADAWTDSVVRFRCLHPLPPQPQILVLQHIACRWFLGMGQMGEVMMRPAQEIDVLALGEVELDFAAAKAAAIVVAKRVGQGNDGYVTLEIVRPLRGSSLRAGQKLESWVPVSRGWTNEPPAPEQPEAIYFFGIRKRELDPHFAFYRRPLSHETAVVAAIRRRDSHPLVPDLEAKGQPKQREVLFRGSLDEAIRLIGSDLPVVESIGGRRLLAEQAKDSTLLPRLIQTRLAQAEAPEPHGFRSLRNLINLLGDLQKQKADAEFIGPLLDRKLAHLSARPEPPQPTRRLERERDFIGEEDQGDVNHSLVWLLRQRDTQILRTKDIPRVVRLRDTTTGFARREAQLALDVLGVGESEELAQARQQAKELRPLRALGLLHLGSPLSVAFSPDGRFLAGGNSKEIRVWKVSDGSLAAQVPCERAVTHLRFSPDGKFVYLAMALVGAARCDWRKGKVDAVYRMGDGRTLDLSADDRRLVIGGLGWASIFDTETEKQLDSFATNDIRNRLTLSPDGRNLIYSLKLAQGAAGQDPERSLDGWWERSLEDPAKGASSICGDRSGKSAWLFVPEAATATGPRRRYLLSLEWPEATRGDNAGSATLRVHDRTPDRPEVASRTDARFGDYMVVSADGQTVVVMDRPRSCLIVRAPQYHSLFVTALAVPSLKVKSSWEWVYPGHSAFRLQGMALSPDGRTLALATDNGSGPVLLETRTGRPLLTEAGHPGQITDLFFLPDGKTLRTIDDHNEVRVWDVDTLRVRGCISLGANRKVLSSRPGDGQYLLCHEFDSEMLCVVDAGTGGVVSRFPKLRTSWDGADARWLDGRLYLDHGRGRHWLDYLHGKAQAVKQPDYHWPTRHCLPEWSGDRPTLRFLEERDTGGPFDEVLIDLDTGKRSAQRRVAFLGQAAETGQVPGGRYDYLHDPHFHLLDRRTLTVVAERRFATRRTWGVTLSGDGSRFAVLAAVDQTSVEPSSLCVHETHTGRMLAALPAGSYRMVRLNRDGSRVVAVLADDTLEMWDLSKLAKKGPR